MKMSKLQLVLAGNLLLSSVVMTEPVMAEPSTWEKTTNTINDVTDKSAQVIKETGAKVAATTEQVVGDIDKYVDDSSLTAKVKTALASESLSVGYDISVSTHQGVVTLAGFVPSIEVELKAVKIASEVAEVKLVKDKLNIRPSTETTLKGYASDTLITSEIKAKLIKAENVPLTGIAVETVDGIVQLTGTVTTQQQADLAEIVAKGVEGVKTVKNDLVVRP